MFCPSCGSKVPDGTKFCEKCGMPIKEAFDNEERPLQQEGSQEETTSVIAQKIKNTVDKFGLTKLQKAVAIVAASSALIFLICVDGTLFSWISAVSALLLTYLCVKKSEYDTKAMAIAYTVFSIRFLIFDISAIFGSGNVNYRAISIIIHLLAYACPVVYWLMISSVIKKKEIGSGLLLSGSVATALCVFIDMFASLQYGFRNVIFRLGWMGFLTVYAMLIITDNHTITYIKKLFSGTNESLSMNNQIIVGQFCSKCGSAQPSDAIFCDKCGNKLDDETSENSSTVITSEAEQSHIDEQPVVRTEEHAIPGVTICQHCGAKQENGSLFCDKCGYAVASHATQDNSSVIANKNKSVCSKCGNQLEEGSLFCDSCGTKIE